VNTAYVRNIDGLNSGCIDYWSVNSIYVCGIIRCGSDSGTSIEEKPQTVTRIHLPSGGLSTATVRVPL
jgi:hypothetical protein